MKEYKKEDKKIYEKIDENINKKVNNKIKKIGINVIKYISLFVILIGIYIISIFISSKIPTSWIKENVKQSSEILVNEGERKFIDLGYKEETIFNFTDALMINIAYSLNPEEPLESIFLGRKNYVPGQTKKQHMDSQYNLGACDEFINKKTGDLSQTKELYALMHRDDINESFEYARYWHGYTSVLRPMLIFMNYSGIRNFNIILITILIIIVLYKLYKKLGWEISLIFLIGLLSISIFIVTYGMNEIMVFMIALVAISIILFKKEYLNNIGQLFFIIGSVTNFFDFLTAPLVTFALPLIVVILLEQQKNKKLKDIIILFIKLGVLWSLGYACTWAIKWILTSIILKRPIISNALTQAKYRMADDRINILGVVKRNLYFFGYNTLAILVIFLSFYTISKLIKTYIKTHKNNKLTLVIKDNIKEVIPFILTAMLPLAWYMVLKEHSYVHAFFTYRILIVMVISVFLIVNKLLKNKIKMNTK